MHAALLEKPNSQSQRPMIYGPSGLPINIEHNLAKGWTQKHAKDLVNLHAPDHVLAMLEKSRQTAADPLLQTLPVQPRMSMQSWEEAIYVIISDGAQVLNSTSETIMVPDFTLPANYLGPARSLKYTVFFDYSTVITTPGTITLRFRYGGAAGTLLAASGAYAPDPTAAGTNLSGYVEFLFMCRGSGATAATMTMGRMWLADLDDASATTLQGNLNMHVIPASAPAAVNINTTTANALTPTVQFSVNTATTQLTAHLATLEALT